MGEFRIIKLKEKEPHYLANVLDEFGFVSLSCWFFILFYFDNFCQNKIYKFIL